MGALANMKHHSVASSAESAGRRVVTLLVQRIVLIIIIVAGILLVAASLIPDDETFAGQAKPVVLNLISALLAASTVSLIWDYAARKHFTDELKAEIAALVTPLTALVVASEASKREGLLLVTSDFYSGLDWDLYISSSNRIDLQWWAGRTWMKQHDRALRQRFSDPDFRMRVILPDVDDDDVLNRMSALSDNTAATLRGATHEARELLSSFPSDKITILTSKTLPSFVYMRFDQRVVISPYPLTKGRNSDRPVFVFDSNMPAGQTYVEDFTHSLS